MRRLMLSSLKNFAVLKATTKVTVFFPHLVTIILIEGGLCALT